MRSVRALCVAMVLAGLVPAARAETPSTSATKADAAQQAAAEDLYQQGIALASQGSWAEAATKLEESNRIDRAPGTTLNLAECYVHLGRLASAWSLFEEAAAIFGRRSPPDARAAAAKERAAALHPKLSRLRIDVPQTARVAGLLVKRDGALVGEAQWGTAIAVDSGSHMLEVIAPDRKPWRSTVNVQGESATVAVTVPVLEEDVGQPPAARSNLPAYVVGAAGAAALIVGGALVGVASAKLSDNATIAPKDASGKPVCGKTPSAGEDLACATLRDNAEFALGPGNAGIGILVGGGVLIAASALWLLIPSKKAPDPRTSRVIPIVGNDGGGLVLTGSF